MIHVLRMVYERSPRPLQRAAAALVRPLPGRLRYGSAYARARTLIRESQHWTRERLDAEQAAQLRAVVMHAVSNSPYHRQAFASAGVDPGSIRAPGDLARLPLLTRDDVRDHQSALLAADVPARARKYVTTGGTSGKPLGFYIDKDSSAIDWAYMLEQWRCAGYRDGDLRLTLRGRVVVRKEGDRPWLREPLLRELVCSSYHLDERSLDQYAELIERYRPRFLHAYPSTAYVLAQHLRRRGVTRLPFRAALLGSENLLPAQRTLIEDVLGCRVYSWYGHSEKCILAGECEHSSDYHVFPQYGVVEIVDAAGTPITEPAVPGRLVGTSLISRTMPLIRYLTDDVAQWAPDEPCACGRPYRRMQNVVGRWDGEVLIGRSGAPFSIAALNLHTDVFRTIRQFQFYQDAPGVAVLRVVPAHDYGDTAERELLAQFRHKIGHDIDLSVERVSAVAQSQRGKFRFIDQRIPAGG
jgi:phenylacetate-CoA ligase